MGKNTALGTSTEDALNAGQIGVFVDGSTTAQNTVLTAGERFKVVLKDSSSKIADSQLIDFDLITGKN